MLKTLKRMFLGPEPVTRSHPVFGQILFMKVKNGGYWESEPAVEGKPTTVIVEASLEGPAESQVQFFHRIASSIDEAFALAAPLLRGEYEKWVKQPFPDSWREAFTLTGFTVPQDGNAANSWDISFECLKDKAGHHFTASFEGGQPSHVTIDG